MKEYSQLLITRNSWTTVSLGVMQDSDYGYKGNSWLNLTWTYRVNKVYEVNQVKLWDTEVKNSELFHTASTKLNFQLLYCPTWMSKRYLLTQG